MFSKKKEKVHITAKNPIFYVKYLGRCITDTPCGKGCTNLPVQKIWNNIVKKDDYDLPKVVMTIDQNGITLKNEQKPKSEEKPDMKHFGIEDISYCCAEKTTNEKIFSWIYKSDGARFFDCHAVLCSSKDKAKEVCLVLSYTFQVVYKDWKRDKRKVSREESLEKKVQSSTSVNKIHTPNQDKAIVQYIPSTSYHENTSAESTSSDDRSSVRSIENMRSFEHSAINDISGQKMEKNSTTPADDFAVMNIYDDNDDDTSDNNSVDLGII